MYRKIRIEKKKEPLFQIHNIAYARVPYWFGFSEQSLQMDMIRPQKIGENLRPAIIWLTGGGWMVVDRAVHLSQLNYFAERGYTIFSVSYRTSNDAPFPAPLEDVKAAIRYIRAHNREFGIDKERIAVMGESAGGNLASLVGVTTKEMRYDKGDYLEESSSVQAAVDWYGPADLTRFPIKNSEIQPEACYVKSLDKNAPCYCEASPITHISKDTPPFLILHGSEDEDVPCEQSRIFYEALQNHGICSDFIEIEGAGHADIQFCQDETKDIILDLLDRVL